MVPDFTVIEGISETSFKLLFVLFEYIQRTFADKIVGDFIISVNFFVRVNYKEIDKNFKAISSLIIELTDV